MVCKMLKTHAHVVIKAYAIMEVDENLAQSL